MSTERTPREGEEPRPKEGQQPGQDQEQQDALGSPVGKRCGPLGRWRGEEALNPALVVG